MQDQSLGLLIKARAKAEGFAFKAKAKKNVFKDCLRSRTNIPVEHGAKNKLEHSRTELSATYTVLSWWDSLPVIRTNSPVRTLGARAHSSGVERIEPIRFPARCHIR